MEEIIKELRSEFNRRKDNLQEDNIRIHIIANTFLEYCGYDTTKCIYEAPTGKGYCDMLVPSIGNNAIVIEVLKHSESFLYHCKGNFVGSFGFFVNK